MEKKQSYVFVANHQGAFDIFLIYGFLGRNFKWMMKKGLRKIPLVGVACEYAHHIFVDKSGPSKIRASYDKAREELKEGMSLVVFPEGARTFTGHMGVFRRGAFMLADELQLPRGRCSTLRVEPLVSAVRRLEDCYRGLQEKIVQLEGKKRSQKQLITSLRNRPFYHLLHRKGGQLPDEKCDALPLRAEKLSLPQSGDSDLEVAQRATGVIRLATLCSQSQEKIVELERDLASQSEYLLDLQTKLLSILWGKVANLTLFWGGVVIFLYFIKWMLVA